GFSRFYAGPSRFRELRFRKPLLYPLSYGGPAAASHEADRRRAVRRLNGVFAGAQACESALGPRGANWRAPILIAVNDAGEWEAVRKALREAGEIGRASELQSR